MGLILVLIIFEGIINLFIIETPGIGTYELDYYNLNNSINKNLDYEPYVVVKKPPFNSSEPRFVQGASMNKGI